MSDATLLTLYAVRNRDGKYFHNKGYGGFGTSWADTLEGARIYSKPGPARAQVTYFSNTYPQFGVPGLVELHVTRVVATQETERVQKSKVRKEKVKAVRIARHAQLQMNQAKTKLAEALETISKLGGKS